MLSDKRNWISFRISWPLVIVIICVLMSIGYTTVNNVTLAVDGDVVAMQHKGVFVYDVQYKNGSGSSDSNNLLKVVSDTLVHTYLELSTTDSSSYVTYTITVLNNQSYAYEFKQAVFDEDFYNNENIIFDLNNTILPGDIIEPSTSLSFDVTFKYKSGVTPSTLINKLDAYVNFEFVPIAMVQSTNAEDQRYFRNDIYIEKIKSVNFERGIGVPTDAIDYWDIGVAQNGNVMAYLLPNTSDSNYYDLFIQSETQLYAAKYMGSFFRGLKAAEKIYGLEYLDTSRTTSMVHMFTYFGSEAESVELNLNVLDTSNVLSMESMFNNLGRGATNVTLIIDEMDTSNVTNMKNMFYKTGRNSTTLSLDVSNFDTSKVTDMESMFQETGYTNTAFTLDVSNFNTSSALSLSKMFYNTGYSSTVFTLDVTDFNTSNVTNMSSMFRSTGYSSKVINLDVSNWDTKKVADMSYMFHEVGYNNSTFSINVSNFDTNNVTNMNHMFNYTGFANKSFQLDVSNFKTSNVTNFSYMFAGVGRENTAFVLDVSGFDTSSAVDLSSMFYYVGHQSLVLHLDVSGFDTSNVTNMNSMFKWAGHENPNFHLDVSNFDTSKVTDMGDMFRANGIRNPNFTLNLSNFDTSNVTNMEYMFYFAGAIAQDFVLDLGGFDTSKVTNMSFMFNNSRVNTIYVSDKWDTSNVTSSSSMFSSCSNLVGGAGTVYNSSVTDKTYARIDGGVDSPGYLTLKPEGYKMLNYIQSSGTQYIDTGFSDEEGFMWEMTFEYTDEIISRYLIGSHNETEPYGRNGFRYETNGGYWQLGLGDGYPTYTTTVSLDTKYKIIGSTVKGNSYVDINGTRVITSTNNELRSSLPVILLNNQYGLKYYDTNVKAKIYLVKLYDSAGTLVRYLVPCINESGQYGLYDKVNGTFYGNSGTGSFTGA